MATRNFWKENVRKSGGYYNTPEGRIHEAEKKVISTTLWLLGAAVVLIFYGIAMKYGYMAIDISSLVLVIIVGAFLAYSIGHLKEVNKEREELLKQFPKCRRSKNFLFRK